MVLTSSFREIFCEAGVISIKAGPLEAKRGLFEEILRIFMLFLGKIW